MRIVSVQGVLPEHRYTQAELTHAFTHEMLRGTVNESVVRRFHENACVDTRHTALPLAAVRRARRLHRVQRRVHRGRCRARRPRGDRRAQGGRADPAGRRPDHLRDGHRPRRAVPRRSRRRADRDAARRGADAAGRARLRRRCRRGRAAQRLPARPPRQRRRAHGRRAVLVDLAARRRVGARTSWPAGCSATAPLPWSRWDAIARPSSTQCSIRRTAAGRARQPQPPLPRLRAHDGLGRRRVRPEDRAGQQRAGAGGALRRRGRARVPRPTTA